MGNVQKKLIPWQSLMAESDTVGGKSQLHGSGSPSQDSGDGLILVASLVDRIPNLGGKLVKNQIDCTRQLSHTPLLSCISNSVVCDSPTIGDGGGEGIGSVRERILNSFISLNKFVK